MGPLDPINPLGESGIDILVCGAVCSRLPDPDALRTEGRPPCTVVLDHDDDVLFTRAALASHDPAAGRIVVHPAASNDRLLWHAILQALGTRRKTAPATREEQESAVQAALQAAPPCQLTVLRAHRIGLGLWADLVYLHRTTRADLVLVHHAELPDGLAHLLRHCDHRIVGTLAGMEKLHPPATVFGQA